MDQREALENDHHGSESWESERRERLSKRTFTLLFRCLSTVLPPDGAGRARSDWQTGRRRFDTATRLSPFAGTAPNRRTRFRTGTAASACRFGGGESSHRRVKEGVIAGGLSGARRMNRRVDGCVRKEWSVSSAPATKPNTLHASASRRSLSIIALEGSRGLTRGAPSVRARGAPGILTDGDLVRVRLYVRKTRELHQ